MDAGPVAPRTRLASLLMLGLTVAFALVARSMLEAAAGIESETWERVLRVGLDDATGETFGRGMTPQDAQFWFRVGGWSIALLVAWSFVLTVGVAGRRVWAREAGALTFLAFALLSVPFALLGLISSPRPDGLLSAAGVAITTTTVVVLLASVPVGDDVERATFYRRRRRTRGAGAHGQGSHGGPDDLPELAA